MIAQQLTKGELVDEIKKHWPHAAAEIGRMVPPVRDGGMTDTLISLAADLAMDEIHVRDALIETQRRQLEGKRFTEQNLRLEVRDLTTMLSRKRWWKRQH